MAELRGGEDISVGADVQVRPHNLAYYSSTNTMMQFYVPGYLTTHVNYSDWIDNFPRDRLLILSYSQLVSDLPGQLGRLGNFLNLSLTRADVDCVLRNSRGVFKREKKRQNTKLTKDIRLKVDSVKLTVTLKAQIHSPDLIL